MGLRFSHLIYKIAVCLICVFTILPLAGNVYTSKVKAEQLIKVAYVPPEVNSVEFMPIVQNYRAYMDEIAKYAGWKYTLLAVPPEKLLEKLHSGEVDLVLPIEYYPSDEKNSIIFNKHDIFYDILCLYYKDGISKFQSDLDSMKHENPVDNIYMLHDRAVGVLDKRENVNSFEAFAKENSLNVSIVKFDTVSDMEIALQNGAIDLMVDTITRSTMGVKQLLAFETIPARVIAMDKNQHLIQQLDDALAAAWKEDEDTMFRLSNDFFEHAHLITTHFSADEIDYINTCSDIKIVLYGRSAPYIDLDEHNEPVGIYPDILRELLKNTGLKYKFVFANSYEEAQTMMNVGLADVMLDIYNNDASAPDYHFTNPVYSEKYTLIGLRDSAGVLQDTLIVPHPLPSLINFVQHHMPRHLIQSTEDVQKALTLVNQDPRNMAIAETLSIQSERTLLLFPRLSTVPTASISVPLSIAIAKHRHIILRSILNKGIQRLDQHIIEQIVLRHTMHSSPNLTFTHLLHYYPVHLGLGVCLTIIFLSAGGFLFYNYHMTRIQHRELSLKNDELERTLTELQKANKARDSYRTMAEKDALTGVYNKSGMEQLCREEFKDMGPDHPPCVFIIIDLDHFKQLNDTCGHQKGDEILRKFAQSLRSIVRKDDLIGRFGGDEFVVLLRNLGNVDFIKGIAHRMNIAAQALDSGHKDVKLSASIGIAIAPKHGSNYEEIFNKADKSVYVVKENGRDDFHIYSE